MKRDESPLDGEPSPDAERSAAPGPAGGADRSEPSPEATVPRSAEQSEDKEFRLPEDDIGDDGLSEAWPWLALAGIVIVLIAFILI